MLLEELKICDCNKGLRALNLEPFPETPSKVPKSKKSL